MDGPDGTVIVLLRPWELALDNVIQLSATPPRVKFSGSVLGLLVQSKTQFVMRCQDRVKPSDPLERVKRLVEVLEYNKPQVMAMKLAAELSTGEVIHMPKIVRVDMKARKALTIWGDPIGITCEGVEFVAAYLITRDNRLISKKPFDYKPKLNEVLQMRIALSL